MRYAAIGDSFTEGVGDERPDGSCRGWADRVAEGLAAGLGRPVQYANLAVRGRLLEPIVTGQLDLALAMDPLPTLITLNGGGNDMMRPGVDADRLVRLTEHAVHRCADAGVRLVLLSGADPSQRLPLGRTVHRRGVALTRAVKALSRRYDLLMVDAFNDAEVRRAAYWSPDRLHLNAAGHARVAALVLTALGHPTTPQPVEHPVVARELATEARYYREHVAPWLARRLRGRSSGDDHPAKHTGWTSVEALPTV
ncbi:SGNH/GDSL hydrolase family protein [Actinosynnema sp. NPDC047251]|uniref:Lipolytic protein, G-D-S-L family n=1 Tax=Saccharothrix espanaensis (strain ATCC 51144 / DSM 44229 / JCM 9112 / NBRC 15066 / NRRL 15764) TaxID=1179773 RepID=K0JXS8_SACES|nr:SGNH/GDSL hydrolase family protein [Saccharothrix espanaensis]CCH30946.1 Lipolytic protein, G-D-S-L family [Saccharothrix espanaensis DSM 44229]